MLNRKSFLIIICFISLKSVSQNDIQKEYKWNVKLGILNFIDPANPAFQIGLERFINSKNSLQFEAGYILPYNFDLSEEAVSPNSKGYIFKASYKYWFVNNKFYAGPEIFTRKNDYTANLQFTSSETTETGEAYYDIVKVRRDFTGANIVFGYVRNFDRFFLDFMAGAGLGHRKVTHSNRIDPNDSLEKYIEFRVYEFINEEMDKTALNVTLNIKLGYKF
ncbi:DUF3575 domain-containing protein [Flavobacterium caeni]|uniref:Outer membrane protein beta-barrel domain-containing protein n=1 Tax=Flavobacterium caeni TaxID=490189 RepID=A0A1G5KJK2_9FLAO|nr:DUF3575 domain-containing protein [Flavobacterium caeni]SCZ00280.1 Protein of unknown function [Flavobacterium caeni]